MSESTPEAVGEVASEGLSVREKLALRLSAMKASRVYILLLSGRCFLFPELLRAKHARQITMKSLRKTKRLSYLKILKPENEEQNGNSRTTRRKRYFVKRLCSHSNHSKRKKPERISTASKP